MAHTLFRLTESIFSKPLLMTQDSCEDVLSYLDFRNSASMTELTSLAINAEKSAGKQVTLSENGIGTVNIFGPISANKTGFEALCQNTSHEGIVEQATALFMDDSVNTVLLNVRSGGGHAHKTFESALRLRQLSEDTGKRLITYIDETACSAAFAHAISAGEVVINPTAKCGSIGVLLQLIDDTKALEMAGYERTFVTSSDGKIPYAKEGGFREDFVSEMQDSVSELYEDFINHVTTMRKVSPELVRNTNAGVYSAEKALELGFVDKIMTTHEFYDYLASLSESQPNTQTTQSQASLVEDVNITQLSKTNQEETLMSETINTEQLAELQSQMEAQAGIIAAFQAKESAAEKASLSEQLDGTPFLSGNKEQLVSFFMSNDVAPENKSLMNAVIDSCKASNEAVVAEAAGKVVEAELAVETANNEKEAIKEEFATTQTSVPVQPKEQATGSTVLADKIAAKKAALIK